MVWAEKIACEQWLLLVWPTLLNFLSAITPTYMCATQTTLQTGWNNPKFFYAQRKFQQKM